MQVHRASGVKHNSCILSYQRHWYRPSSIGGIFSVTVRSALTLQWVPSCRTLGPQTHRILWPGDLFLLIWAAALGSCRHCIFKRRTERAVRHRWCVRRQRLLRFRQSIRCLLVVDLPMIACQWCVVFLKGREPSFISARASMDTTLIVSLSLGVSQIQANDVGFYSAAVYSVNPLEVVPSVCSSHLMLVPFPDVSQALPRCLSYPFPWCSHALSHVSHSIPRSMSCPLARSNICILEYRIQRDKNFVILFAVFRVNHN